MVLELPEGMAEWVQCHCLASLDEVVQLAGDHLVAYPWAGEPILSPSLSIALSCSCFPSSSLPFPQPYTMKTMAISPKNSSLKPVLSLLLPLCLSLLPLWLVTP